MTRSPRRPLRTKRTVGVAAGILWLVAGLAGPVAAGTDSDDGGGSDSGNSTGDAAEGTEAQMAKGEELYGVQCSSCHGAAGEGVGGSGPSLTIEGPAAVDFVLRTGRMPLADPHLPPERGPVRLSESEIQALVAYVGSLGDGPEIPEVDISDGDLTNGGDVFRLNCAACHVASGAGAIIGSARKAPELSKATPTEVAEAILVGPGAMPVFGELTEQEVTDVAAYIADMQEQGTTDADSLGGIGPVAEGLVTWLIPLAALIALTRWIGTPNETSNPPQPDTGTNT